MVITPPRREPVAGLVGWLCNSLIPVPRCRQPRRLRHAPCLAARTGCLPMLAAGAMPVCIEAVLEAVEPARGKVVAVTDTRVMHLAEQAEDMVRMRASPRSSSKGGVRGGYRHHRRPDSRPFPAQLPSPARSSTRQAFRCGRPIPAAWARATYCCYASRLARCAPRLTPAPAPATKTTHATASSPSCDVGTACPLGCCVASRMHAHGPHDCFLVQSLCWRGCTFQPATGASLAA